LTTLKRDRLPKSRMTNDRTCDRTRDSSLEIELQAFDYNILLATLSRGSRLIKSGGEEGRKASKVSAILLMQMHSSEVRLERIKPVLADRSTSRESYEPTNFGNICP
jgi:hypothetical protein